MARPKDWCDRESEMYQPFFLTLELAVSIPVPSNIDVAHFSLAGSSLVRMIVEKLKLLGADDVRNRSSCVNTRCHF